MLRKLSIPLPRNWPRHVKRALLEAIGLERMALAEVRAGLENSPDPRAQAVAQLDRASEMIEMLLEVVRIVGARIACIPAHRRPHYPPAERGAILRLRARFGWSLGETARWFGVTPATIAHWMRLLEEQGEQALVQTRQPVNRYDDAVTELVQDLHVTAPGFGRRKKAAVLMRAGVHLAASTVERMQERPRPRPAPPPPSSSPDAKTADSATKKPQRVVTAKHPHHVWHVDITSIPIGPPGAGFWATWWPFALVLRWALSWHIAIVLDHFSRAVVAFGVFPQEPTGKAICEPLEHAVVSAGRAPKYMVSDQGSQFQSEYRDWCEGRGVRPRFGAIGKKGSIAVIERCIESLKYEFLKRIPVPYSLPEMLEALAAWQLWYNEHRPHEALGNRTPAEVRDALVPRRERERIEPRARMPLARAGPGGAALPPARRPRGKLEIVVDYAGGFRELPVVELREVA